MPDDRFVLEISPLPAYISTARLFVGAVARHHGLEESGVEDAKIAVSEACTSAIRLREGDADPSRPIRVAIESGQDRLRFEIEDALPPTPPKAESTTEDITLNLGAELIQALFPEFERLPGETGEGIRFSVPVEVPAGT